jgi:hypothetical protein
MMLIGWLVFPIVLGVLSFGWGRLVARLAGIGVADALVLPLGLASIIVVALFATLDDATAELAAPVVVGGALGGIALSVPWRRRPSDLWAAAAAVAVFAVFAAPVVFSGEATFAGYVKLDDTATWLAMTDRVMEHGRSLDGLAPSTYEATLHNYLATGYPVGSFLPLGVGRELVGTDLAWLFQPYLAFLAAMMALCFYSLAAPAVSSRLLRALVATIASQPALLFAYSLWGGVKEVAAAWILALVAALMLPVLGREVRSRALVPLAVASAAALGVLSVGGGVWLAPPLLLAAAAVYRARGALAAIQRAATFLVVGAVLSLPALLSAQVFLRGGETLRSEAELGNLVRPLSWLQFFGIWPAGDFRTNPSDLGATRILILVLVLAGVIGLGWAWTRRAWGLMLYVFTATTGCLAVTLVGSPWVDAKALATASPAFVLAGLVGAVAILNRGRRIEALVFAAAIAGGVLWSNALAYRDVNLAPHDRLAELEQIGERIAGQGPTLMTDYEPYGVRHFLRNADAEGASELRRRVVPLRSGQPLEKLGFADIDQFQTEGLLIYRTLVLRRSPVGSRPPSLYRLVSSGHYYDVWQRSASPQARLVERLPLGDRFQPAAIPRCGDVLRLARDAGTDGTVAAISKDRATVVELSRLAHPADWTPDANDTAVLYPRGSGTVEATMPVTRDGRYGIWVGGSFRGTVELIVDGRKVASERHQLSHSGQYVPLASPVLNAGRHTVALRYQDGGLHPGGGGTPFALGPLAVAPEATDEPMIQLPAARARELCGRRLDWLEALS